MHGGRQWIRCHWFSMSFLVLLWLWTSLSEGDSWPCWKGWDAKKEGKWETTEGLSMALLYQLSFRDNNAGNPSIQVLPPVLGLQIQKKETQKEIVNHETDGQSWLNYLSICKEILSPWNRWTILIKHSIYHLLIIYYHIYSFLLSNNHVSIESFNHLSFYLLCTHPSVM